MDEIVTGSAATQRFAATLLAAIALAAAWLPAQKTVKIDPLETLRSEG